ncbi:MAG: hypothetical protein FWD94_01530 [Treponema sp.]|nr:hypothetical protein [Treponema sp.]
MKTLDEYMNDPDIVNEPMPWREIHAVRLKIYDETKDMTFEERKAYYRESTERFFASMGKPVPYAKPGR